MKNNRKDSILKYLAGVMTDSEKAQFEWDLENIPTLKTELEKISSEIAKYTEDKNIELEETYLASIAPRVRQKIDSRSNAKYSWRPYIGFAMGIMVLLFYADSFFQKSADNIFLLEAERDSLEKIIAADSGENINNYLAYKTLDYLADNGSDYNQSELEYILIEDLGDISTETLYQNEFHYFENSEIEKLEESDIEHIYTQLEKIKFL